jgi:cell division protein FtsI/penicillin-binding protein 2
VQKTHGDQKGQYTSLFVGFTPVENPEWVCVVVADNPKRKEHYGSKVAAPAVMNVLRRLSEGLAPTSSGPYLERSPFGGMLLSE